MKQNAEFFFRPFLRGGPTLCFVTRRKVTRHSQHNLFFPSLPDHLFSTATSVSLHFPKRPDSWCKSRRGKSLRSSCSLQSDATSTVASEWVLQPRVQPVGSAAVKPRKARQRLGIEGNNAGILAEVLGGAWRREWHTVKADLEAKEEFWAAHCCC